MVTEKFENLCTGCGVCATVCPKRCLKIELDNNGFYKACCDETSCIHCNLCDKVCPKFMDNTAADALSVLSAVTNDNNTLKTTSSGGLCYELGKKALLNGKKVCGCVYNYEKHRAEHVIITDLEALNETKGSKYFQSYTPDAFANLYDGEEWVVFGSPCQIAAIDAAAKVKNVRDKLLLVDFFCHGTPSMNLWKKYIAENDGNNIKKIDFRSKEYGWHTFSLGFTYNDNQYKSDFYDNMFYNFFFGNLCLGESCYSCKFKALNSAADVRVGDFWAEKYKDNKDGVSCCVTFTEKGNAAIKDISETCVLKEENIDDVLCEQMTKSPKLPPQRKKLLKSFKGKRSLKTINNTTLLLYRVKCKIKSIF